MAMRLVSDIFGLQGRTAIVVGGASGIGAGIARMLADAGARVTIMDRAGSAAGEVAAGLGDQARAAAVDVTDEEGLVAAFAGVFEQAGTPWLLVNCAGVQDRVLLTEGASADWDRNFAVNLRGSFLCLREVSKQMIAGGGGGRIVNITSTSGAAPVMRGLSAYSASKAGANALTRSAAFELMEHGITVNAVMPGGVDTPGARAAKGPPGSGRALDPPVLGYCTPEDIGAAVLYFASPMAGRCTGTTLAVDGGFLLG